MSSGRGMTEGRGQQSSDGRGLFDRLAERRSVVQQPVGGTGEGSGQQSDEGFGQRRRSYSSSVDGTGRRATRRRLYRRRLHD